MYTPNERNDDWTVLKISEGRTRLAKLVRAGLGLSAALGCIVNAGAQNAEGPIPAELTAAAARDPNWKPEHFSWGHPNLEGTFTSRDMTGFQMQRNQQYGTRQSLTLEEFRARASGGRGGGGRGGGGLLALQQEASESRLSISALDSGERGTRTFGYTSYLIDPENGQMPARTEEGQTRRARSGGQANGPFYTMDDFSYYDRCITRGITGSIMPSLYGDAMRIVQSPNSVAISYEMLHDTRIIPLDGRAQASPGVRQYMGSSVGHFEGDTLVVETTNFTDEVAIGGQPHSTDLKLTERFTRIDPEMINYVVTVDDPKTFTAPWTFRMTLTTQPDYEVLEYSCHEGNTFIRTALRAEQNFQRQVAEARAKGEPEPQRARGGGGNNIFTPPSAEAAQDIGTQ